jgi:hypothetical protein
MMSQINCRIDLSSSFDVLKVLSSFPSIILYKKLHNYDIIIYLQDTKKTTNEARISQVLVGNF